MKKPVQPVTAGSGSSAASHSDRLVADAACLDPTAAGQSSVPSAAGSCSDELKVNVTPDEGEPEDICSCGKDFLMEINVPKSERNNIQCKTDEIQQKTNTLIRMINPRMCLVIISGKDCKEAEILVQEIVSYLEAGSMDIGYVG